MIISPGRNYIFVHIPKTGGTSLALALEGRAMKDDLLIGDTPKARKRRKRVQGVASAGRLWKHSTLRDIDGLVSRAFIEGAFVVTMVRNPWDRVVSYYHWLRAQGFDHPAVRLAKAVGFSAFLNHPQTRESLRAHPYESYVKGPGGRERCDLFIRLEAFAEDAAPLWEHLGFRLELPHANASERGAGYREYYSEADSALVGEVCGEDIARFGYVFA
jgi:hypothetical protein